LFVVALITLFVTFTQAGGEVTSQVTELPPGVITWVGYANRLVVVIGSVWTANVAWQGIKLDGQES